MKVAYNEITSLNTFVRFVTNETVLTAKISKGKKSRIAKLNMVILIMLQMM